MDSGTVEKGPLWQSEIGDGVPVVEAFYVRPVLLGISRRHMTALARIKCHRPLERLGEDLVDVTLLAGRHGSIRQGNPDGRHVATDARRLDEGSPKVEKVRPFPGVLGARDLPIGAVH